MSNFILQLLINLFVLAGGYFVGKRKEHWKFTQEIKQRHLKEIQEQVFQPLLEILKNHWFPILERKRVNLQIKPETKYEKNTVTPNPVLFEYYLLTYDEPSYLKPINQYLYKDVMDKHYPKIIEKYEAFKSDAEKYVKDCLSYAKEIEDQISHRITLPKFNRFQSSRSTEWIKSCHLAKFIIRKQIVPDDENLSLKFEEVSGVPFLKLIRDDSYEDYAICKNPEGIKEIIDEILKKHDKVIELISLADKLKINCLGIRDEIEKLCLWKKLFGDCNYIKF